MFTMTIRSIWARKLRFALTGLAVILGVAFMAGTFVLTDTVQHSFDSIFDTANANTDLIVQDSSVADDAVAATRIDATVLEAIRGVDGVAAAEGSIAGFAQLVGADGEVLAADGIGGTIGTNWVADDVLNPFDIASGGPPVGDDDVVLDASTIAREGWRLGDSITVFGNGGPRQLTIVGSARYGTVDGIPGTSLVAVNDATAQQLFAEPGKYDAIVVRAADGTSVTDLAIRLADSIGNDSIAVVTGEQDTETQKATMHENLAFFNTFLLSFAWIALFVGTFIIYNTFSIVVAQRQRESAMLRAIGASRRQVVRSILLEATILGTTAAAIGLGAGIGVAKLLKSLLSIVGLDVPADNTVLLPRTIIVSLVVGIAVTVVSAIAPAINAGRVKPISALRDVAVDRSGNSRRRVVAGTAVLIAGAALFMLGVLNPTADAAAPIGFGALLATIGVSILGPVIVRPATSLLGAAYPRMFGTVGRIARENSRRNPRRTAATASALMIGVALVTFITVLAASSKASLASTVDRTLRADYVVDSGAWDAGGFSPTLAGELAQLPSVDALSPVRTTTAQVQGHSTPIQAVNAATIDDVVDLDVVSGSLAALPGDHIAIQTAEAEANGWSVGDAITVDFAKSGPQQFTIAALFDETFLNVDSGKYLVDLDTFAANVTDQFDLRIYVSTAPGVSPEASYDELAKALDSWPNAELQDQATVKAALSADIDQVLNLVYGMLALAVIIALIGIANTLGLSIHERRREIGVLRAMGMDKSQVRRAVRLESVLVALLGTALGVVVAMAASWGIVHALSSVGVSTFAVPFASIVVIVAAAIGAGVLAATGPARRAARLDVLDAIASQ